MPDGGASGRGSALVVGLLLLVLPALITDVVLGRIERATLRTQRAEAVADLDRILGNGARAADPAAQGQELVERVARAWRWGGNVQELVADLPPAAVQLHLFDRRGRKLAVSGFTRGNRVVAERLAGCLLRLDRHRDFELSRSESGLEEAFFGSRGALSLLVGKPGCLLDLRSMGVGRLAGWFPLHRGRRRVAHLVAVFDLEAWSVEVLARRSLNRLRRLARPPLRFGLIDLRRVESARAARVNLRRPDWWWLLVRQPLRRAFTAGGQTLAWADVGRDLRMFARGPLATLPPSARLPRRLVRMVALAAVALWFAATLLGRPGGMPIRWHLMLLFGSAGVLGVGSLLGIGWLLRNEREDRLQARAWAEAEAVLARVDASFDRAMHRLGVRYRALVVRRGQALLDSRVLAAELADLPVPPFAACLVGGQGRIESEFWRPWRCTTPKHRELIDGMHRFEARQITSALLGGPVCRDPARPEFAALEGHLFIDDQLRRFGRPYAVVLFGENLVRCQSWVRWPDDPLPRLFTVSHEHRQVEIEHVRRMVGMMERHGDFRLVAMPGAADAGVPVMPLRAAFDPELRALHQRIRRAGATCRGALVHRGQRYLVAGRPAAQMPSFDLLVMVPAAPLQDNLRGFTRRLGLMGALILALAVTVANLVARRLLEPLRELETGAADLIALRRSRPLRAEGGDELAAIVAGIDGILTDLGEMALARSVQEHLQPAAPLVAAGWRWSGQVRAAGMVAGVLVDHLALPDGRQAGFLIAAAGGGVPAALVLASLKMSIRLGLERPGVLPGDVLADVKWRLQTQLARVPVRWLLAIVDPACHQVQLAGEGLPAPVRLAMRVDGQVVGVAMPLVARPTRSDGSAGPAGESRELPAVDFRLGVGDRCRLCTDARGDGSSTDLDLGILTIEHQGIRAESGESQ